MNKKNVLSYLSTQKHYPHGIPDGTQEELWFDLVDAKEFLHDSCDGTVPLFVPSNIYFYTVLVSEDEFYDDYVSDFLEWDCRSENRWGCNWYKKDGNLGIEIEKPLSDAGGRIAHSGEPVFTLRDFPGISCYAELNQKIGQILDIHWQENRKAYCRTDENGDYFDVVTINRDEDLLWCTMDRVYLDLYMYLTKTVALRLFDITRLRDAYSPLDESRHTELYQKNGIYGKHTIGYDHEKIPMAGWMRGFQIIRQNLNDGQVLELLEGKKNTQYATFCIWDWKNKLIRDWSCSPIQMANYFTPSVLPFETSPAFFRPEVLDRYKADPDKYEINPWMIRCRAAWSLRYGINDEKQVHVYL